MTIDDVEKVQKVIKCDIEDSFNQGDLSKVISRIDTFADFTQRFNNILRDDQIEDFLSKISENYIESSSDIRDGGDKKVAVFYDNIGTVACLGVQYLRGLFACGYKIVYIYDNSNYQFKIDTKFLEEVKKYCADYCLYHSFSVIEKGVFIGNTIRKKIVDSNPSVIISHFSATSALGISVLNSIKGARKIRIVPGDHHFYLGYDCFDNFIDFRPFGWSTSVYERKISPQKIYNLNFYPLIDDFTQFAGFPTKTKGKVIIASGGATYKFQSSNFFHEALEHILLENTKAVFLYLGTPSKDLTKLKKNPELKDRIFMLGYRKDFAAVIKHIDILFNSYPFSGGLFCQTAAKYSKPILAYSPSDRSSLLSVEYLLGYKTDLKKVSMSTKDMFYKHAASLINDYDYRAKHGEYVHSILQTKENFDKILGCILNNTYPTIDFRGIPYVDRSKFVSRYLYISNNCTIDHIAILVKEYGYAFFYKFHFIFWEIRKDPLLILKRLLLRQSLVRKFLKPLLSR